MSSDIRIPSSNNKNKLNYNKFRVMLCSSRSSLSFSCASLCFFLYHFLKLYKFVRWWYLLLLSPHKNIFAHICMHKYSQQQQRQCFCSGSGHVQILENITHMFRCERAIYDFAYALGLKYSRAIRVEQSGKIIIVIHACDSCDSLSFSLSQNDPKLHVTILEQTKLILIVLHALAILSSLSSNLFGTQLQVFDTSCSRGTLFSLGFRMRQLCFQQSTTNTHTQRNRIKSIKTKCIPYREIDWAFALNVSGSESFEGWCWLRCLNSMG